jgi:hypothetical protein
MSDEELDRASWLTWVWLGGCALAGAVWMMWEFLR